MVDQSRKKVLTLYNNVYMFLLYQFIKDLLKYKRPKANLLQVLMEIHPCHSKMQT